MNFWDGQANEDSTINSNKIKDHASKEHFNTDTSSVKSEGNLIIVEGRESESFTDGN